MGLFELDTHKDMKVKIIYMLSIQVQAHTHTLLHCVGAKIKLMSSVCAFFCMIQLDTLNHFITDVSIYIYKIIKRVSICKTTELKCKTVTHYNRKLPIIYYVFIYPWATTAPFGFKVCNCYVDY